MQNKTCYNYVLNITMEMKMVLERYAQKNL